MYVFAVFFARDVFCIAAFSAEEYLRIACGLSISPIDR